MNVTHCLLRCTTLNRSHWGPRLESADAPNWSLHSQAHHLHRKRPIRLSLRLPTPEAMTGACSEQDIALLRLPGLSLGSTSVPGRSSTSHPPHTPGHFFFLSLLITTKKHSTPTTEQTSVSLGASEWLGPGVHVTNSRSPKIGTTTLELGETFILSFIHL